MHLQCANSVLGHRGFTGVSPGRNPGFRPGNRPLSRGSLRYSVATSNQLVYLGRYAIFGPSQYVEGTLEVWCNPRFRHASVPFAPLTDETAQRTALPLLSSSDITRHSPCMAYRG